MVVLNPDTKHKEFSGSLGCLAITIILPIVIFFFALSANEKYCVEGVNVEFDKIIDQLPKTKDEVYRIVFNRQCWLAYICWFFGLVFLDLILPGKHLNGVKLRDGTSLNYKINGFTLSSLMISIFSARLFQSENYYLSELAFVYDNYFNLAVVATIFSFILACFVYCISFIPLLKVNGFGTRERILSINGNTGNLFYDWFIGRELNPRIGSWDIKLFCELRPGLPLWLIFNLSCVHHQYHSLGKVSDSLLLVTLLQGFYVFDGVMNEEGCLTMMDIATDGFGFMLSFGDLAWLPFTYSLQARYLSVPSNWIELGKKTTICLILLNALGYYIFHSSNKQKSEFRQGKLDHLNFKFIQTKTGSKLLCDGWWGLSQHINYLGDWIIGWSWCLPTLFKTPLTYFYVIYFGILLLHRQIRDESKCKQKYGESWKQYQEKVPYKIIPYVY